jgi:hypothetical protein
MAEELKIAYKLADRIGFFLTVFFYKQLTEKGATNLVYKNIKVTEYIRVLGTQTR